MDSLIYTRSSIATQHNTPHHLQIWLMDKATLPQTRGTTGDSSNYLHTVLYPIVFICDSGGLSTVSLLPHVPLPDPNTNHTEPPSKSSHQAEPYYTMPPRTKTGSLQLINDTHSHLTQDTHIKYQPDRSHSHQPYNTYLHVTHYS